MLLLLLLLLLLGLAVPFFELSLAECQVVPCVVVVGVQSESLLVMFYGLTEQLQSMGIRTDRMKTGTPPRIDISSVDLSAGLVQNGDASPSRFSFLPVASAAQSGTSQMPCYIFHTNEMVHDILRSGFSEFC